MMMNVRQKRNPVELRSITPRQREILVLIAGGMPGKIIARKMGLSAQTVKNHRLELYRRVGGKNSCDTVMRALALGLLQIKEINLWNVPAKRPKDVEY